MTTSPETTNRTRRSGLDLRWVDPGTRPQDDLFGHVNGTWLTSHVIPDDRAETQRSRRPESVSRRPGSADSSQTPSDATASLRR